MVVADSRHIEVAVAGIVEDMMIVEARTGQRTIGLLWLMRHLSLLV